MAIFQLAIEDKEFNRLCIELLRAAERLYASERGHRRLFTAPVDPKFLSAWRDFEARYEHILAANWAPLYLEVSVRIFLINPKAQPAQIKGGSMPT